MKRNFNLAIASIFGMVVGVGAALSIRDKPGYAAGYDLLTIVFATFLSIGLASILLLAKRTRQIGAMGVVGFGMVGIGFFVAVQILGNSGAWLQQPSVKFGPDVKASLVVLFPKNVSPSEENEFVDNVIGFPDPRGKGHDMLHGIQEIFTVNVDSHHGYAIQLAQDISAAEASAVKDRINHGPMVWKVYENVAAAKIKLEHSR